MPFGRGLVLSTLLGLYRCFGGSLWCQSGGDVDLILVTRAFQPRTLGYEVREELFYSGWVHICAVFRLRASVV